MVDFFGVTFATFHCVLLFYTKVRKLGKIYEWQTAILPLAIDYHTEITTGTHTDVDAWTLPQDWIDQYCSSNHILSSSSTSKKRSASTTLERSSSKMVAAEVCRNFNTKGCTFKDCAHEHKLLYPCLLLRLIPTFFWLESRPISYKEREIIREKRFSNRD